MFKQPPLTFLAILFCFVSTLSFAQVPEFAWAFAEGNTNSDLGNDIVTDPFGNVYLTGRFRETVDFDPGSGILNLTAVGNHDIFVQKLDTDGNLLWVKSFGNGGRDIGKSIDIDADNNVYISGEFEDQFDFNPGGAGGYVVSNGQSDAFILKLNTNGGFVWVKQIGGTENDVSQAITTGPNNVLYVGMYFASLVDFDPTPGSTFYISGALPRDMAVVKLNQNGSFIWAKAIAAGVEEDVWGLDTDGDGNLFVCGAFTGSGDFDPDPIGTHILTATSAFELDWFILKLDAAGAFKWAHAFGHADNDDIATDVAVDKTGNVHVVGNFFGAVDLDPGAGNFTVTSGPFFDIFHQSFDTDGNFKWGTTVPGVDFAEWSASVATDKDDNSYLFGTYGGAFDFDPGPGDETLTPVGFYDLFIQKLDVNGNYVWAASFGDDDRFSWSQSITIDESNGTSIFTTGQLAGAGDFDPTPGVHIISILGGFSDIFIQKLRECTEAPLCPKFDAKVFCEDGKAYVSVTSTCQQPGFSNPFSEYELIEYDPNGIIPSTGVELMTYQQQGGSNPYLYSPGPFTFTAELLPGRFYLIIHRVWDGCNEVVEEIIDNIQAPDPIQFNTGFNFSWDHDLNTLQPLLVVEGQSQPAGTNPYHQFNLFLQDPQGINAPTLEQTFAWWQQSTDVTPVYTYKEGPFTFPIPLVSGQTYTIQRGCWDDCNSWQATSVENIVAPVCDPAVLCNPSIYEYRFACFDMCGNNRWLADFAIAPGDPCYNAITKVEYYANNNQLFGMPNPPNPFVSTVPPYIYPYCTSGPYNVTAHIYYGTHPVPLVRGYYAPKCQIQGKPFWTDDPGNNGVSDNAGGVGNGNGQNNAGGNGNGNGNGGNNGNGNGNGGGNNGNGNGNGNGGGSADGGLADDTRSVSVQPNPASSSVSLVMEENPTLVEIIDLPGVVVLSSTNKTIDVSMLKSNLYFIRVTYPDGVTVTRKFVKL